MKKQLDLSGAEVVGIEVLMQAVHQTRARLQEAEQKFSDITNEILERNGLPTGTQIIGIKDGKLEVEESAY